MSIRKKTIVDLSKWLGVREAARVYLSAKEQTRVDNYWKMELAKTFRQITDKIIQELLKTGNFNPKTVDFKKYFMEQSLGVMRSSYSSLPVTTGKQNDPALEVVKLGLPAKAKIPRSFADLMKQWDFWKKTGRTPKRQREMAEKVKRAYLEKVQSVFDKHSEAFRSGEEFNRDAVIRQIRNSTSAPYSRAKMITETETTYYYNQVRREVYDESPDVTHYLFIAVRDQATTKWCKTRTGIVYKKGDPLLEKETPPCHWNCRSELLPLTPLNPRHQALIEDKSKARRNNVCYPLPSGWTGR